MKKLITFIIILLTFNTSFTQNVTYYPSNKIIWQSTFMGEEQHSVELTNTNKIYFYFDDKEYTYVSSYGSAFFSIEEADSFFNSCLSLLNHPYSDGDLLYFEMNGLSVYRNNSMLAKKYGFKKPILIIYDDKAWTIIQKSKIKSIIQSLNSVK